MKFATSSQLSQREKQQAETETLRQAIAEKKENTFRS